MSLKVTTSSALHRQAKELINCFPAPPAMQGNTTYMYRGTDISSSLSSCVYVVVHLQI